MRLALCPLKMELTEADIAVMRKAVRMHKPRIACQDLPDVIQDACLRALRSSGPREPSRRFSYLWGIARHAAQDYHRTISRSPKTVPLTVDPDMFCSSLSADDPLAALEQTDYLAYMASLMKLHGVAARQIAKTLHITQGDTTRALRRAREFLEGIAIARHARCIPRAATLVPPHGPGDASEGAHGD